MVKEDKVNTVTRYQLYVEHILPRVVLSVHLRVESGKEQDGAMGTVFGKITNVLTKKINWRNGLKTRIVERFGILSIVKIHANPPLQMDQTVWHVNIQTSLNVIQQATASTVIWCVTIIPTQTVVGMMKAFITA